MRLQRLMPGDLQHDISGARGRVQQISPFLFGHKFGDSLLSEAVDAETEQIGERVVAGCDAAEDIIRLRVKAGGVGGFGGVFNRHRVECLVSVLNHAPGVSAPERVVRRAFHLFGGTLAPGIEKQFVFSLVNLDV